MDELKQLTEHEKTLLKTVFDNCMQEDTSARERQIRKWRRLKLLWDGFQKICYDSVAHDWRVWDEMYESDTDQSSYDKPVNIFKSYLETIIAALSVSIPPIKCFPDDADDTLDLATAKAGDKIAQLIYRHVEAPMIWLHALFVMVTEGMTACYIYPDSDKDYGTYKVNTHEDYEETTETKTCPLCGEELSNRILDEPIMDSPQMDSTQSIDNKSMPNPMGMAQATPFPTTSSNPFNLGEQELENLESIESELCPSCEMNVYPETKIETLTRSRIKETKELPKSRVCMEVYGGLYVKVPNYVKCQKDSPYLILSYETDYSMAVEEYETLKGNKNLLTKLKSGSMNPGGSYNQYAQWGRLAPQYVGEFPENVVTINHIWIRPAKFNILTDDKDIDSLKRKFPNGVRLTYVNDEFAACYAEALDDH